LTGLPASYGNSDVTTLLASGNVTSEIITSANISGNYFIGDGSQLTGLPPIYNNSNVAAYLPTYTGNLTAGNVSTSGNVVGANLLTSGSVSAAGQLSANTLNISSNANILGNLNVQGNVTFINSNVITTNDLYIELANNQSTYSNINGAGLNVGPVGSPLINWTYNSTANAWSSNIGISSTGNIRGAYILGNGSQLTGLPASYGNSNVAAYLPTYSGNIGNITAVGNISANYFIGNGSQLTGLPASYGNSNVAAYLPTFTGNLTAGNISSTGNIQGNYILGNGSQLTGLPATYTNSNVVSLLSGFGSNSISTSGNITAGNFIGNGAGLTNLTVTQQSNIIGTQANVTLVAGSYSYLFDNTGNLTMPTNGDIVMTGTNSILSVGGTALFGGYSQVGGYYSTLGVKYPGGGVQHGMTLRPVADNTTAINFLNAAGNSIGNITQTSSTVKFAGDGSGLTGVATQVTGSWTLTTGTNSVNFSVPGPGTYTLWVNGNIPNGIVTYTATVTVTNQNVPVVGTSYGWYYSTGNALVLTAIPTQIIGTANGISTATVSTTTAWTFAFGITNNSGSSQTVSYGYTRLG